jgi:hypothetical protein
MQKINYFYINYIIYNSTRFFKIIKYFKLLFNYSMSHVFELFKNQKTKN